MEYWQKDIETMNREDLKKLQFERLRKTIEAAGNSPFLQQSFQRKRHHSRQYTITGRFAKDSFYDERRPSQQLSVRHGGYSYQGLCPYPFVKRHDR